jgi:hypothetical protein
VAAVWILLLVFVLLMAAVPILLILTAERRTDRDEPDDR